MKTYEENPIISLLFSYVDTQRCLLDAAIAHGGTALNGLILRQISESLKLIDHLHESLSDNTLTCKNSTDDNVSDSIKSNLQKQCANCGACICPLKLCHQFSKTLPN